jgi:cytochrome c553
MAMVLKKAAALVATVSLLGLSSASAQVPPAPPAGGAPAWAYPINPPGFKLPPDDGVPRRVPGSTVRYKVSQLRDPFLAPDWHPQEHPAMPVVVSRGRRPDVMACGTCHRATGTGGPENANIAGLPRAYIVRQLQEYRSGVRASAVKGRAPTDFMISTSKALTDAEIEAAADYFSALKPVPHIRVVEAARSPKLVQANWLMAAAPGKATEPLGRRIVEVPEDLEQFEARDPHARFVAYVPVGSLARGEQLAKTGGDLAMSCATCHGEDLKGMDDVPPIVGRSPTYMVRQLYDFKVKARRGEMADQMEPVVANLTLDDMIALAAYLASLEP